ncbi:MAG: phosphotyrosine protein phosphatase [Pontixanthobacter sp.]
MAELALISRRFGTFRGLVRLALSYVQQIGPNDRQPPVAVADVRRLVFVCHGNICRSAFAEIVARDLGMPAASLGLSTTSGKGAHAPVVELAGKAGFDLSRHLTTAVEDFEPQEGDFLLAMEFRHLSKLAADPKLRDLPRDLLGLYHAPSFPHLHDPYRLDPAFMALSLERIRSAVERLAIKYPCAASDQGCS